MDKIKIHELAKKLDVNSKLVVEKAQSLGMNVKSHLSTITTEEAEKITKAMGKAEKEKNEPKKEVTSKQPVIMRRTVIIDEEEEKKEAEKKSKEKKPDIGFVEKQRKKDYNIVYRNKQSKPMSVAELFGIPSKKEAPKEEEPVKEVKIEEKVEVKQEEKVEIKQEEKTVVVEKPEKVVEEKKVMREENNTNIHRQEHHSQGNREFNRHDRNNFQRNNNGNNGGFNRNN